MSETWWKMLQYVYEITPPHCSPRRSDAVSPLFSVLVLWMNYLISSFPFSQPHLLTSWTCSVRETPNHSVSAVEVSYAEAVTWTVLHRFQGRGFYGDGYWVVMLTTVVAPTLPPPHPQRKMWYSFGEVCFCRIPGFWRKIISPVSIWPSLCWLRWIKALKTTLTVCRLLCYKWKIYLWQRFEVCTIGISRCFQLIYDTFQILFINKQLFVTNRTICRTAKPLHFICSVFTECRDYLLLLIS